MGMEMCVMFLIVGASWMCTDVTALNSNLTTSAGNTTNATCTLNSPFRCVDNVGCTTRLNFCNAVDDCSDRSDEVLYNQTIHGNLPGRKCGRWVNGGPRWCYIPEQYVCDTEIDCFFGNDECNCNTSFYCVGEPMKMCRVRVQFCDFKKDCNFKGSDEWKYAPGVPGFQCSVTKTHITNYCMLPTVHVCDGISDCDDGTDECFCSSSQTYDNTTFLNNKCFRCLDKTLVVPSKKICDGVLHCKDLSDECFCPNNRPAICAQVCKVGQNCGNCSVGQVSCTPTNSSSAIKCINRTNVCDGQFDCPNQEDENNCEVIKSQTFTCADGKQYIPKYQRCDNYNDCSDKSDEIGCSSFYQCLFPVKGSDTNRPGAYLFSKPKYATACDGIAECATFDDECNATLCSTVQPYCSYVKTLVGPLDKLGFICPFSKSNIIGKEICDGYPTCNNVAPHLSADEFNCSNRFYCADHGRSKLPIHVPLRERCNGITDCNDVSDEIGCNETTHFYCASGSPLYIRRSKVCNGIQECQNGEDECQNCATSPFSSDKFLISSYVLQALVWITGLLAISGNIAVIIHNAYQMKSRSDQINSLSFVNRILVSNLAVADLLLGIYLVSLGAVNSIYENIYCRKDIHWRGSSACIGLGCLAMISVEGSVFILALMTSYRYYVFSNPFDAKHRAWLIGVLLCCTWLLSMILAFVPLSYSAEDYFVSGMWYSNNPYLENPTRLDVGNFVTELYSFGNSGSFNFTNQPSGAYTWRSMIATIAVLRNTFVPQFNFGYYSAHGVCLPRLFPDPINDKSWGYSLFIIIINFVCFVYMVVAYTVVYRKSVARAEKAGRKDEVAKKLQRKITRIVISNFCCWIPICVMAFISVSGIALSKEAYAVSAIVLLPINSAANPFLYSNVPDILWNKIMQLKKGSAEPSSSLIVSSEMQATQVSKT